MRIALINAGSDRVGGVETYLEMLIRGLAGYGWNVTFLSETVPRQGATPIALAGKVATWNVQELGIVKALERLSQWTPDVIYAHGRLGLGLMRGLPEVAPVAFYAHDYYGTCISGAKSFKFPVVRPCQRNFGLACLLQYYPRRCGGLNPSVMWRLYRVEMARLGTLRKCRFVLTASTHMRAEYLRHGFHPGTVRVVPYPVVDSGELGTVARNRQRVTSRQVRLAFVGRMTRLKGGRMLIDAVERLHATTGWEIQVTLVGDGPQRRQWERAAKTVSAAYPAIQFAFGGWLSREEIVRSLESDDLLVVPSVWPEPFGLVGPEAGRQGLPAAAFGVGGVAEWLRDGVNGHLAPGDPPTADGLADAIIRCLADPAHYANLRQGAVEVARQFTTERHLQLLLPILHSAADGSSAEASPTSSGIFTDGSGVRNKR